MEDYKVDFVILWVDGNDPDWQAEKRKYAPDVQEDDRIERYRDWENLRYWFRGVEKYAPWVNKIYFVTWGHLPEWLDTRNKRLVVVNHTDFIPEKYLPTFNCNPIELNLHRIQGLSEHFVYFNDDMFLINHCKVTDFFKRGLPCDTGALNIHCINAEINTYAPFQAIGIINKYFELKEVLRRDWRLWLNPKNGRGLLRTLYLLPSPRFPGIYQTHLPTSFLKSTYKKVWELESEVLRETCTHRFRNKLDYTQWVFKNWQLASGNFAPRNSNIGRSFIFAHNHGNEKEIVHYITGQKGKMICINDGAITEDEFQEYKQRVISAFEKILPDQSGFER